MSLSSAPKNLLIQIITGRPSGAGGLELRDTGVYLRFHMITDTSQYRSL